MTLCIDFDGTIVEHLYPEIGAPVPMAIETMRELQANGHHIILFTMRHGETLKEAIEYVEAAGITLYGANENPSQKSWSESRKVYGHHYIDDAAIGCPLVFEFGKRPYVDWKTLSEMLRERGILKTPGGAHGT